MKPDCETAVHRVRLYNYATGESVIVQDNLTADQALELEAQLKAGTVEVFVEPPA